MSTLKDLLVMGGILLFVGIMLPLIIIATQGGLRARSKTMAPRKGPPKTPQEIAFAWGYGVFMVAVVIPVAVSFAYHFVLNVSMNQMPVKEFLDSWGSYSYKPVLHIYGQLLSGQNPLPPVK